LWGSFFCSATNAYLLHLQVFDLQVSGVHFLVSQTHLLEHAFTQVLALVQQVFVFVLLPAIAANDINIAVPAIKI
jgi:hypothetical protein